MWQVILAFGSGVTAAALVAWRLVIHQAQKRKAAQRKLLRRTRGAEKLEKLAQMGVLTSHLAHEIRNPLSTIRINLQLLAEDITALDRNAVAEHCPSAANNPHREYQRQLHKIATIVKETDRLADKLNDFLRYAGRMELHPVRCDVNEILDDLIDFDRPQALSRNVPIRQNLTDKPAFCRVDPDLIKQAFLNLFINATQAMGKNGDGELIVRSVLRDEEVEINVIDTGPGIPEQLQEKIFEAYYTTKPGGTGLGLPTCRRIIEEHDGHIDLHSEPGKGTSFTIVLPLTKT